LEVSPSYPINKLNTNLNNTSTVILFCLWTRGIKMKTNSLTNLKT